VLLNLCINAQDALRGRPGTVSTSIRRTELAAAVRATLEAEGAARNGEVQVWTDADGGAWAVAGRMDRALPYVSLVVADTGPGMEASLLEQAFTPFFTTKERGLGAGLGLAVVKGVVAAHAVGRGGAVLVVHSRPGEGTEIEVALPRLAAPAIALPTARVDTPPPAPVRPKPRILLVDDDADFSDMMSLLLERLGFEAVPYIRAREALADFRELPLTWDALISDQNMPEMSGLELIRAARALRPDLPCLVCSAYSETLTDAAIREAGALTLIRKPVDRDLLLSTLERALGTGETAAERARSAADPSI
jgi:CheY-like chemotaxis protein